MKQEMWKQVKGWEDKYEVSNQGNVKRVKDGKMLTRHINPRTGYEQVSLYDQSTKTTVVKYVHRLVAEAFIPNPKNLEQVDHKDGNKSNNRLSNIRWCSRKFNNSRKRSKMLKSANHNSTSHIHQFVKAEKDG